jgi:methanogenic corrinoid protein MtbC1
MQQDPNGKLGRDRVVDHSEEADNPDGTRAASAELMMLSQTLERELIPRLMQALKSNAADTTASDSDAVRADAAPASPTEVEIEEFIHLIIHHDASIARGYVQTLRERGVCLPTIYTDLFAAAARRLGELWEQDDCDFTQVTIAVCRMHQLIHGFSDGRLGAPCGADGDERTIMLVPAPGDQHTFGLLMVGEFFRRAGWGVYNGSADSEQELLGRIARQSFTAVGVSISHARNKQALQQRIAAIREASRNKNLLVVAGGHLVNQAPEVVDELGADCCAEDGDSAVAKMAALLDHETLH